MPRRLNLPRATVNAFQRDLVRWYHRSKRALPWRGARDPYRVWVSEIMLQQTRVETVREYYRRWMRAFPTLESLARAPYPRVLKLWEGLGYYSRARHLHQTARLLAKAACRSRPARGRHRKAAATLPSGVAELMQLPGIGRYTAGAIASIAFGQRAPVVDGNVRRVLARVFGRTGREWETAEALLPDQHCGDFNQALMELGALVCLPSNPRCEPCPLRRVCVTRGDTFPPRRRRRLRPAMRDVVLARQDGRVLLRQRPPTGLLAGLWELPAGRSGRLLLALRHTITDRRVTLRVWAGQGRGALPVAARTRSRPENMGWFTPRQWQRIAMPAAHRRALEQLTSTATAVRPRR
jgi:A/G-specific adenine glycosylase